jgi:hypothetical protein
LQLAEVSRRQWVMSRTKELVGIKVDINAAMIGGNSKMKRFIADGGNGVTERLTDKYIIDPSCAANIRVGLSDVGKLLFPNVDKFALKAHFLEKRMIVINMLIEIARQHDAMTFVLMLLNEFDQVFTKIMARFEIGPMFLNKSRLLLMVGCSACLVGWFFAHLICRDKNGSDIFGTLCAEIRPAAVFVTLVEMNSSGDVALCDDGCTSGFVIGDGRMLAAAQFHDCMVKHCSCGVVESLADMVFASVDFVFDDALDIDFEAFLIHAH